MSLVIRELCFEDKKRIYPDFSQIWSLQVFENVYRLGVLQIKDKKKRFVLEKKDLVGLRYSWSLLFPRIFPFRNLFEQRGLPVHPILLGNSKVVKNVSVAA